MQQQQQQQPQCVKYQENIFHEVTALEVHMWADN
jgi:hypothetical protein